MNRNEIDELIVLLSKLPGLGKRSAKRAVLHLIENKENMMLPLADLIKKTAETLVVCSNCGNIDTQSPCNICTNPKRDEAQICVLERVADLWALERANIYQGKYHVLGGTLSAIDGKGPEELRLPELMQKVKNDDIKEIVIATNATMEGQTTAYYISDMFADCEVKITRLSYGIPIGGEIDYLDEGTLGVAFNSRTNI